MNFWYEIGNCHLFSSSLHLSSLFFNSTFSSKKQKQLDTNLSSKEFNYALTN